MTIFFCFNKLYRGQEEIATKTYSFLNEKPLLLFIANHLAFKICVIKKARNFFKNFLYFRLRINFEELL